MDVLRLTSIKQRGTWLCVTKADGRFSSGFETAATILGGSTALGYMVIGLLAFILGVCVTVLCFRIRQLNKEEQTEMKKEDDGDGTVQ